jgi:hypothetical protein
MYMCDPHIQNIKSALVDRGLWKLVKNQNAAQVAAGRDVDHSGAPSDFDPETFDPLEAVFTEIYEYALNNRDLHFLTVEWCPCCELERQTHASANDWIKPCTQQLFYLCQAHGLMPWIDDCDDDEDDDEEDATGE